MPLRMLYRTSKTIEPLLTAVVLAAAVICMLAVPIWLKASESSGEKAVPALNRLETVAVGEGESCELPVLLYHHIVEDSTASSELSGSAIYREQFEQEMAYLADHGFETVSFQQMIDYVEEGIPLPSNPVCITFDDGYLSNYEIAFPILKKYGMKATIFVIGATVGNKQYYKDTQFPITPHFDYKQAREMSDTGLISIQTHTYDMHQRAEYESGPLIRKNILRLKNESEKKYAGILEADFNRAKTEIEEAVQKPVEVLAYPGGSSDELSEQLLASFGVKATLSIHPGKAELVCGQSSSLQNMNRFYVKSTTAQEEYISWLE